ncbi:hypothetical protein [Paenibacillus methanolicus]|uniref:Lipoprotein n=1 Tax=Paenibacillus methanolicus TaxID=582686 RepID=A0A5S5C582_9BACL|nr:hypothetical protein [Paenibacillus methanolicus]TYP74477.1 hypothetical protein BCM02_10521 [Paenibacillus methanolicus]
MNVKLAAMVLLVALCSACANRTVQEARDPSTDHQQAVSSPASASALDSDQGDLSVRALGTHTDGRLLIKPGTRANVHALGAPSCYGLETDLSWTGDYEAWWEPASGASSGKLFAFPIDFEIIQPSDEPIQLQRLTVGTADLFVFVPRYTDCHARETYLFGVEDGQAFPITFDMKTGLPLSRISQHPLHPLRAERDELVVYGGQGAGQDSIAVYHFRYNAGNHSMVLEREEQQAP